MLLSPPLAGLWVPRIKRFVYTHVLRVLFEADISPRIILDEIHTIGQQEGGAVWEQIILLAPCPIM